MGSCRIRLITCNDCKGAAAIIIIVGVHLITCHYVTIPNLNLQLYRNKNDYNIIRKVL